MSLNRSGYEFGVKRNFMNGQAVIISDLGDGEEYSGMVRGKSFDHVVDSYIVELTPESKERFQKHSTQWDWDCISITESCLRGADVAARTT